MKRFLIDYDNFKDKSTKSMLRDFIKYYITINYIALHTGQPVKDWYDIVFK